MIKVIAYDSRNGKEYDSYELKDITFFDENGILRGIQCFIKLKYELIVTNEDNEDVKIEIR
ncbi:MAG: hypothetical protein E6356_14145 [Terrisporobacter othiniensis]|nr:hypothetical protein [Terrisporobacter othiniensis]